MFFDVSYIFFCDEFEFDGCQLDKFQGQRSISRSNIIFQQMKLGTSVIPHFHMIFDEQSISKIILIIQGHLQGQKVNFKVKY